MSVLTKIIETCKTVISGTPKACYFCKRRSVEFRNYRDRENRNIKVCPLCVEYAERRAFRK